MVYSKTILSIQSPSYYLLTVTWEKGAFLSFKLNEDSLICDIVEGTCKETMDIQKLWLAYPLFFL